MAAFVQGTGEQSAGSVASVAKAFASNVAAGSLLVALCVSGAADIPEGGVTDTLSNTYRRAFIRQRGALERVAVFWAISASAGACTVTLDATGSDFQTLAISEFSGTWDLGSFESNASADTVATPANSLSSGNLHTPILGVVVGLFTHDGAASQAITPDAAFTQYFENENTANMPINAVYKITVAGGDYSSTWTTSGATSNMTCGICGFRESLTEAQRFMPCVKG